MTKHLEGLVREAVDALHERADALGGPPDVVGMFHDAEDHAEFDEDPGANYCIGLVTGIAAAQDMTPMELLDELGLTAE